MAPRHCNRHPGADGARRVPGSGAAWSGAGSRIAYEPVAPTPTAEQPDYPNRMLRSHPMLRFEDILDKVESYKPDFDEELLDRAFVFSAREHRGQVRSSGEPYLVHPLNVAYILAEMRLDETSIAVGLLHDVLEDTLTTKETLQEIFGDDVAELVDGVTKISPLRLRLEGRAAGRDVPQDAAGDGQRPSRRPGQTRRPPPQHAHARVPRRGAEAGDCERDDGDLRADRQPPRHGTHQERAGRPLVPAHASARVRRTAARGEREAGRCPATSSSASRER